MRFSLKSVMIWSFFLIIFSFVAHFLSTLHSLPLVWDERGISLSIEVKNYLEHFLILFKRYVYWILLFYAFLAAIVVFLEERNPDRTLLWLAFFLLFPFIGLAVYIVLGPNVDSMRHRWRIKRLESGKQKRTPPNASCPPEELKGLERLLFTTCRALPTTRNTVQPLINGDETFDAIERSLKQAQEYIHMEYFSVASDKLGHQIKDLLLARVRDGVKVRMMYDAVGSWHMDRAYADELRKGGIELQAFMPMAFARFRSGINHRDHRKIIVVDGKEGFLGGLNIGDMYKGEDPKMGFWRDTHIKITGEAVKELNRVFLSHWAQCCGKTLDFKPFLSAQAEAAADLTPLQIATSGPGQNFRAIADGYFHMITSAQKRIWITTPYLVPGSSIFNALAIAAQSGIDVRIIIPSKADHTLVFWASQFNTDQLLQSGVRIFSYQKGFIHAKTAVMDGQIVSVGTANLDVRSLEINYEVQAFIQSESVARQFEETFLNDLTQCKEETLEARQKRPLYQKLQAAVGRLWSGLL